MPLEVLWAPPLGTPTLVPCVDCGLITGNYCDGSPEVGHLRCFAVDRAPQDYTPPPDDDSIGRQQTPLCLYCKACFNFCRFCRGVSSCTPQATRRHWSNIAMDESRQFTAEVAQCLVAKEIASRYKTVMGRPATPANSSSSSSVSGSLDRIPLALIGVHPSNRESPIAPVSMSTCSLYNDQR